MLWTIIGYDPEGDELCVEYTSATNASDAMDNAQEAFAQDALDFTPIAAIPGSHDVTVRDEFTFHSNPATPQKTDIFVRR